MPRCFSTCRKMTRDACRAPKCMFVDKKLQYCRLDAKRYVLEKPSCNETRKKNKLNKSEAGVQINRFLKSVVVKRAKRISDARDKEEAEMQLAQDREEERHVSQIASRRGEASRNNLINSKAATISKFMRNTTRKRQARFLNSVCSDSGVCIAFGTDSEKIITFFNGFKSLQNILPPIRRIGALSANGFVDEISFSKDGYNANAVLKSSKKWRADNLMYEYYVGTFLNKKAKNFPCFIETYGIYRYKTPAVWEQMENTRSVVSPATLKNALQMVDGIDWGLACTQSKYLCILTQHLKRARTISDICKDNSREGERNLSSCLVGILFQLYSALASMGNTFTHYDLHWKNVLLYEPVKKKYIQYHYHGDGGTITFKCHYIAKIIDYGRSYFFESGTKNSTRAYDEICAQPECDPSCGDGRGFAYLKGENNRSFIMASQPNVSHDLRLLDLLLRNMPAYAGLNALSKTLETVQFGPAAAKSSSDLGSSKISKGTREIRDSGAGQGKINNVQDAYVAIRKLMLEKMKEKDYESIYTGHQKLGDLHVYLDGRPMRFMKIQI